MAWSHCLRAALHCPALQSGLPTVTVGFRRSELDAVWLLRTIVRSAWSSASSFVMRLLRYGVIIFDLFGFAFSDGVMIYEHEKSWIATGRDMLRPSRRYSGLCRPCFESRVRISTLERFCYFFVILLSAIATFSLYIYFLRQKSFSCHFSIHHIAFLLRVQPSQSRNHITLSLRSVCTTKHLVLCHVSPPCTSFTHK
jgi:hypothetical protein